MEKFWAKAAWLPWIWPGFASYYQLLPTAGPYAASCGSVTEALVMAGDRHIGSRGNPRLAAAVGQATQKPAAKRAMKPTSSTTETTSHAVPKRRFRSPSAARMMMIGKRARA